MVHLKCRTPYPVGDMRKILLMDYQVPWSVKMSYDPPEYESPSIKNKPWADPYIDEESFHPNFNTIDGKINRKSYMGTYLIENKRPLNPEGRTGLKGRGLLGRWGPNHAADPIVTKWKHLDGNKLFHPITKLPILQFCAIQRGDNGQWAIPGGMIDYGENVNETLKREFLEESLNSLETDNEETEKNRKMVDDFFKCGQEIYKGYVDDPRNTDNAWMETVAFNYHDENRSFVDKFNLKAGDDAKNVKWIDLNSNLVLYASHLEFIEKVAKLHNAHW